MWAAIFIQGKTVTGLALRLQIGVNNGWPDAAGHFQLASRVALSRAFKTDALSNFFSW